MNKQRPKHLSLHLIRLPLPGVVSILHRLSGAFLFLCIPMLLWMFQSSLQSIQTYSELIDRLHEPASKIFLIVLSWAFFHHFLAGLRYLAIDMHLVGGLSRARNTSKVVIVASLALTIVAGVKIW